MNNSICGENVESDHASLPGGRLDGDVLPPGDIDLLTPGSLQGGRALGHFFGLESSTRDNMTEKHSCEGVLVSQKAVESLLGDLGKGIVGRGKDGEWTVASESVDKAGSFDSGQQGRELGGGDGELCDVLGRGWWSSSTVAVVTTSWGAGHKAEAGQADEGLHGEAEVVLAKNEAEWSAPNLCSSLYGRYFISYGLCSSPCAMLVAVSQTQFRPKVA